LAKGMKDWRAQVVIGSDGAGHLAMQNAGSTLFYGADITLNYAVTPYLDLEASYEHLIAQYTN
jgi:hypothetical protein